MSKSIALPLLADRVLNTPLLITRNKLDAIMSVLGPRIGLDGEFRSGEITMDNPPPAATMSRLSMAAADDSPMAAESVTLAVINVHGTLVHRSSGMSGWSGLRSYESIREDFREARADRTVQGVVFVYDTNGGEGSGLFDLVDELYEARGEIPMFALVNEASFSAGYALASAQDEIYLTRTAGVGSIGVRMRHVDRSQANKNNGLKVTELAVGEHKLDGSPDQPLSDGAAETFTASLRKYYDLFVSTVARNRNMSEQTIRDTNAAIYEGEDAVKIGLADEVMSYNAALSRVAAKIATGGVNMSKDNGLQKQLATLFKGSSDDEVREAMAMHGFVPQAAAVDPAEIEKRVKTADKEARKESLKYAGDIIGLCSLAGLPSLAAGMIREELSVDDARQKLVEAQAADHGEEIVSVVSATATGKISPLIADARARSDKK